MPTLFIIIAPVAIGFLGYVKLAGSFDPAAKIMLNLALFFAFLLVFMAKNFVKLKFFLSWWAFTFHTAAFYIALIKAYEINGAKFYLYLNQIPFILLIGIIALVSYHTIKNIIKREICITE